MSTDWRARRPLRAFVSQSLTVAAAAFLLLVGGGANSAFASYIVVTAVQTNIGGSPVSAGNYNQGQTGSSFTTVGGGTATGTIDPTGTLTAAFDLERRPIR